MKGSKETVVEISDDLAKKYIEQEIQMWAIKYPEEAKTHILDMQEVMREFDTIKNIIIRLQTRLERLETQNHSPLSQ